MTAGQTCLLCGAPQAGDAITCQECGADLPQTSDGTARTVLRSSVPKYPPPVAVIAGIPPTAWPDEQADVRALQTAGPNWQTARVAQQPVSPMKIPSGMPGSPAWIARAAVALAVLGTAALVWFVFSRVGDDEHASSDPSTSLVGQTAVSTIETSATAATPLPASTTILEATTTAVPAPPPAFTPPPVPETAVFVGPGVAYSLADPVPSGLTVAEVLPALLVAQNMADLLAAHQWDSALLSLFYFDGEIKTPAVEVLEAQWGTSDRLSLVLLDARKDPADVGYYLLVGTIANLHDGTTNVRCNHLYSQADADPAVVDLGSATMVLQDPGAVMPEQLLNTGDRVATLQASCVWPP